MRKFLILTAATALAACGADTGTATADADAAAAEAVSPLIAADADRAAKEVPAGWTDFTGAAFTQAQADGRTILVDVHADWCPTCKAQAPILDELTQEDALSDAVFLKVDFDRDKDFIRELRIPRQSTVLLFDGEEELVRSVAETDRDTLRSTVLDAA